MSENNIVRLNKGDKAPNFELESDEYKHYALADFKHQNVVLYFYPKAGTSVCTREAKDFRDNLERFQAEGYAVIGISPDDVKALQEFRKSNDLNFILLSDPEFTVHKLYGAAKEHEKDGKETYETIRSTFVLDGDDTLRRLRRERQRPDRRTARADREDQVRHIRSRKGSRSSPRPLPFAPAIAPACV